MEYLPIEFPDAAASVRKFMICPTDRLLDPHQNFWAHAPREFLENHLTHVAGYLWNQQESLRLFLGHEEPHPSRDHGFAPTVVFVELSSSLVLPDSPTRYPVFRSAAFLAFVTRERVNRDPTELVQALVDQAEIRWHDVAVNKSLE